MRFGIGERQDYTLEEVGKVFGVTRERRQADRGKGHKKVKAPYEVKAPKGLQRRLSNATVSLSGRLCRRPILTIYFSRFNIVHPRLDSSSATNRYKPQRNAMSFFRRSLRAKFTLVLLVAGVIPLAVASLFFYRTTRDALFRNVFKELKWNAETISGMVTAHFDDTARNLLIASRNTAFTMYFTEPLKRRHWALEQQKTLKYLRSLYPESLDEACFIDATGQEVARIVFDKLAPDDELSSDEERAVFFGKAFSLDEGMAYQGEPIISEDTKRWVLPNATPIIVNGKKAAILHFETNLRHMQDMLKSTVNSERGTPLS